MNSRVKVSTEALPAAVKARREKQIKEHATAYRKAVREREAACKKVAKVLRDAATEAEKGNLPDTNYRSLSIPYVDGLPREPDAEPNTARIDRLIATLEMASEPTISISADDAAEYLG